MTTSDHWLPTRDIGRPASRIVDLRAFSWDALATPDWTDAITEVLAMMDKPSFVIWLFGAHDVEGMERAASAHPLLWQRYRAAARQASHVVFVDAPLSAATVRTIQASGLVVAAECPTFIKHKAGEAAVVRADRIMDGTEAAPSWREAAGSQQLVTRCVPAPPATSPGSPPIVARTGQRAWGLTLGQ